MPYIKENERDYLDQFLAEIPELSAGQLNYVITRLAQRFVGDGGYERQALVIGILTKHCSEYFFESSRVALGARKLGVLSCRPDSRDQ